VSKINLPENYVAEDALEFDGDLRCLDGVPYTGSGVDYYRSGGVRAVTNYKDGFEHGLVCEWDEGGRLQRECHARRGMKYGAEKTWHENGKLKSEANFEWGVELDYVEFDENGGLVKRRVLDENSPDSSYKILLKFRAAYAKNAGD
jgi:antitoxin component YwqK of YwqJK toxin-antitoxin module